MIEHKHLVGEIKQEIALVGDREGWYPCDGREMPTELKTNELVMGILKKYGCRLPDLRPEKWFIYLGGK